MFFFYYAAYIKEVAYGDWSNIIRKFVFFSFFLVELLICTLLVLSIFREKSPNKTISIVSC